MGGDFAPEVAIEGAVMSLKFLNRDSRIVLYGDEARIRELIKKHGAKEESFDIVATTQVIEMGDHPAKAFVAKRDSSITVGFRDLSEGKIDGFASAGSTGWYPGRIAKSMCGRSVLYLVSGRSFGGMCLLWIPLS